MKTSLLIFSFLFLGITSARSESGLEIMKKVDSVSRALANSTFSVMGLSTCKFAKTGRKIACVEQPRVKMLESVQLGTGKDKLDSKSISIVLLPTSERGIGMLTFSYDDPSKDTQSWLYLSALGKVKRMASGSDEDAEPTALFGSEFTTEDMETGKLDEYDFTILKEGKLGKRPVWIIQSIPKPARLKKTRYAKSIVWIDQERFLTLKAQTYDKRSKPYKRLSFSKIEQIEGFWVARSILIINQKTNRLTQMRMEKLVPNISIDEEFLTQRSLTDFAFRENQLEALRKHIK